MTIFYNYYAIKEFYIKNLLILLIVLTLLHMNYHLNILILCKVLAPQ